MQKNLPDTPSTMAPIIPAALTTTGFSELAVHPHLLKSLTELDYKNPTPIQLQSIPIILKGHDLIGAAQTGTGKTAAFALPILQMLYERKAWSPAKKPRALIVSPTRELALQIHESFKSYGKYMQLKSTVIFGGVSQNQQIRDIAAGSEILIATPGRLLDLISQRKVALDQIEMFVLDEADRMLDMGFLPDVKRIINLLPKKRQNLFFSATMPTAIKQLADSFLVSPLMVKADPVSSSAGTILQKILYVDRANKKSLLLDLLKSKELDKVIIFTRTKHGANKLAEVLQKNRIETSAIHGNKSQNARVAALESLRSGRMRVLVATDIVARGIDIDQITHVINFDIPNEAESYVHRIGRTGRAGMSGVALSLCDGEERSFVRGIEKLISKPLEIDRNHAYHSDSVENAREQRPGVAKARIESRGNSRSRRPSGGGGGGGGSARRNNSPPAQNRSPVGGVNARSGGPSVNTSDSAPKKRSFFSRKKRTD